MAYISGKDVFDVTFNGTDLKAYVMGIDGLEDEEVITSFRAPGSAYPKRVLTGQYNPGDPVIDFIYEGSANGPNKKCAKGTSSTLTITLKAGMSITGTAVVAKRRVGVPEEGADTLQITFMWDGAVAWDLEE